MWLPIRSALWPKLPPGFDMNFQRWRNLLASAEQQYHDANETFSDHGATRDEHRLAERLRDLAGAQIKAVARGIGVGSVRLLHLPLPGDGRIPPGL